MKDDYAILVGIRKYADESTFSELQGPTNDVALMYEWLTSPAGGNLDPHNIVTILSPQVIAPETDVDDYPPVTDDFSKAFKKMVRGENGHLVNRPGRLYLYFSGHGFCEKKCLTPQATLYSANATRDFPENIFGSYYALAARDKALFAEIVLIMDCCRDAEINRSPDIPAINEAGNSAASDVKLLCIYAAPKGGKAQERVVPERDNKVYGLLTHAIIKALAEAKPEDASFITATTLKRHLLETWAALCGGIPASPPEIVLPTGDDLKFRSQNRGVKQKFEFDEPVTALTVIEIRDSQNTLVARCELLPPPAESSASWNDSPPIPLTFDGKSFFLGLQPTFYRYVLSGDRTRQDLFAVTVGGDDYVRL